jgi:hypothetical protein
MAKATRKSKSPKKTPGYMSTLIDAIDDEVNFTRGIEAAVRSIEGIEKGMVSGVNFLVYLHLARMEAILARANAMYNAKVVS